MNLNYHEISSIIIENRNEANLGNASYDLRAGTIMDMKGKVHNSHYTVPPQGMVYVISKEKIKVPPNIIGFAHVKTALTQKGIMATNIGIIDSGYEGYLSTLLINFSKTDWTICPDNICLRVTFNMINKFEIGMDPKLRIGFTPLNDYINLRRSDTDYLDKKFLNLSSISSKVFGKVIGYLIGLGILFTAGSFAVALYFQNKASKEKDLDRNIKKYEVQTSTMEEENKLLKAKLTTFESMLSESKARIEKLEKKSK